MTAKLWHKIALLPLPLRKQLAKLLVRASPSQCNRLTGVLAMSKTTRPINDGDKIHKGATVLNSNNIDKLYANFITHWDDSASEVIDSLSLPTLVTALPDLNGLDAIERIMALDNMTYLPDDILTKVDRVAMGVSLETRVPFWIIGWWSLPDSYRSR